MQDYYSPSRLLLLFLLFQLGKSFSKSSKFLVSKNVFKTSSEGLQDVIETSGVFNTYWKTKNYVSPKTRNCYIEDVFKSSSRLISKTSSGRLGDQHMFVGVIFNCLSHLLIWDPISRLHIYSGLLLQRVFEVQFFFVFHSKKGGSFWISIPSLTKCLVAETSSLYHL